MNFDIDSVIFITFLAANLIFGLYHSRGIKNIKEYAIGNRNFSTATLVATIVATWVSGESFFSYLSDSYSSGLYAIWAYITGEVLYFFIMGYFLAPRLADFLGFLSIAEAMGNLYGKRVRIITAICGSIGVIGLIAIQLKIAGLLFEYCFGISELYGVLIGGIIVTIYAAFGGIKSVTFTDVIQFFTFGTLMPVIAYFISSSLSDINIVVNTISTNPIFDYRQVFNFTDSKSLYYLTIPVIIIASGFGASMFQRIAIAKDPMQIRKSFIISGFVCLALGVMMSWVGILVVSTAPEIASSDVVKHVLFNYSVIGLKGLILTGIMAMVMSTADSFINTVSVLIVHDICKPIGIRINNELVLARWVSLTIGSCAMVIASWRSGNFMQLLIAANMFYIPAVTIPFIMSLLGFRSSGKSVLIAMVTGLITVLLWNVFLKEKIGIDAIIPAMLANLIALLASHYLLKQAGGWIGRQDDSYLQQLRKERRLKFRKFKDILANFNLIEFLRSNSPRNEAMYVYLGLFCIISSFSTITTISQEVQFQYSQLISFIYPSVLFMATALVSYPLWLSNWKEKNMAAIFWNIAVFYILICVGFLLVIISNFGHLQLIAFMFNLIIIAVVTKWHWAAFMIIVGMVLTTKFLKVYLGVESLPENFTFMEIEATYLLLLTSSILFIFLKPKQEEQVLITEKNGHLKGCLDAQEEQTKEALALKGEFIRNINHEYHAPLTGICSIAQTLLDGYHKFSDEIRIAALKDIVKSSLRLEKFDQNIASLSRLAKPSYKLNPTELDFSELVYERTETMRRLYDENPGDREFVLDIEDDIMFKGDRFYLTQALDNLIINAITYCKKGKVTVVLRKSDDGIEFSIEDEGIGIPKEELYDVFGEFTVSSKTRSPAGNRGVGLALVKRVIDVHGGSIKAESDGIKGATIRFVLLTIEEKGAFSE